MSTQMTTEFSHYQLLVPVAKGFAAGLGTALLAALIFAGDFGSSHAVTVSPAPAQNVGSFTGTYEQGLPVYRLAPIAIIARRGAK